MKIMYAFSKHQFIVFLSNIYISLCVCVFCCIGENISVVLIVGDNDIFVLGHGNASKILSLGMRFTLCFYEIASYQIKKLLFILVY